MSSTPAELLQVFAWLVAIAGFGCSSIAIYVGMSVRTSASNLQKAIAEVEAKFTSAAANLQTAIADVKVQFTMAIDEERKRTDEVYLQKPVFDARMMTIETVTGIGISTMKQELALLQYKLDSVAQNCSHSPRCDEEPRNRLAS